MLPFAAFRKRFLEILHPADLFARNNREAVAAHAFVKYRIASLRPPRSIVETGVRAGYSAWALCLAAYEAFPSVPIRYSGYDADVDRNGPSFLAHARTILGRLQVSPVFVTANTRSLRELPEADFYHVDADHTKEGALHELTLAHRHSSPRSWILADDYDNPAVPGARIAIDAFRTAHPEVLYAHVPSWRGEALFVRQF